MEVRRCPFLDVVLDKRRGQRPQRKQQGLNTRRVDHGQQGPGHDCPSEELSAARRHPRRGRTVRVKPFTEQEQAGDDDANQETGMQVGPQPDERRQQQGAEAAAPVVAQPDQEHTGEQHVEQLGTSPPGRGPRQRADQRQHRRQRGMQIRPPQEHVQADGTARHHAGEEGNQQRQAANLVKQVHAEIGEPLVHHPGVAGGAKRVEIEVWNRAGGNDQTAVGQVPPQVGIQRRNGSQTEDRHEEQPAEHQPAGDPMKRPDDDRHQGM